MTHIETVVKSQMMWVPHMTKLTFLRISPSPQTCRLVLRVVVQHKPTELRMMVLRCKHITHYSRVYAFNHFTILPKTILLQSINNHLGLCLPILKPVARCDI